MFDPSVGPNLNDGVHRGRHIRVAQRGVIELRVLAASDPERDDRVPASGVAPGGEPVRVEVVSLRSCPQETYRGLGVLDARRDRVVMVIRRHI